MITFNVGDEIETGVRCFNQSSFLKKLNVWSKTLSSINDSISLNGFWKGGVDAFLYFAEERNIEGNGCVFSVVVIVYKDGCPGGKIGRAKLMSQHPSFLFLCPSNKTSSFLSSFWIRAESFIVTTLFSQKPQVCYRHIVAQLLSVKNSVI